jgi:hypothetical protein
MNFLFLSTLDSPNPFLQRTQPHWNSPGCPTHRQPFYLSLPRISHSVCAAFFTRQECAVILSEPAVILSEAKDPISSKPRTPALPA